MLNAKNMMKMTQNDEQRQIDEQMMRKALAEAQQALAQGEVPIGAVIACKGRVVARAHNLTETLCDVTAHAEMQAITAAANMLGGKYLPECTLYVTVEPCPMCAGACGWAQLGRIVYGTRDEKRGYERFAPNVLHAKATVTAGVLEEECRQHREYRSWASTARWQANNRFSRELCLAVVGIALLINDAKERCLPK